jgi:transposase
MSRRPRRNHTPAFKAKVALAAIKGDRTLAQPAEQFDVHPNQITSWKAQLEGEVSMFSIPASAFFGRRARIEDHEQCRSTQGLSGTTNYARTLINSHRSVATSPPCERNRSLRINTKGHPRTDNR